MRALWVVVLPTAAAATAVVSPVAVARGRQYRSLGRVLAGQQAGRLLLLLTGGGLLGRGGSYATVAASTKLGCGHGGAHVIGSGWGLMHRHRVLEGVHGLKMYSTK